MTSSTLKALGCLLLAFSATVLANAQNQPLKKSSTITGKVTVKGNGISGITIGAAGYGPTIIGRNRFSGITDSQGNYRISDLQPGTYELALLAPQFVLASINNMKRVIVGEGEILDGVDFVLVRGGVITGKVTNGDGQPLVEEPVLLSQLEGGRVSGVGTEPLMNLNMTSNQTDDRGVFRIYGVPPGRYKVSAGTPANRLGFGSRGGFRYKQTYFPSVTDESQATVIEVSEGSEAKDVDIVVSRQEATFTVSGRIVDGETGKPLPNVRYTLTKYDDFGSSGTSGPPSNGLGEFRLENLTPGKYAIDVQLTSERYADSLRIEVTDHDIADLVIKTSKGTTVSGVVVFDGMDYETARKKYGELQVMAFLPETDRFTKRSMGPPVNINADGSFTVSALGQGQVTFSVFSRSDRSGRQFNVTSVERDGVVQPRSIEIKEREQVTGVRLTVNARTATLQGVVKVENGQLQAERVWVSLQKPGESSGYGVPLDARGRFQMTGLPAGTYNLVAWAHLAESGGTATTKQQVVINDDQVTEVTLTLDLKPAPPPGKP
jgi:protocatechuate 3,4-dioxygenase beta subunit